MSRLFVIPLTLAAAAGGALAGCHPTGTPIVDPLETAAFAAAFTVITSRAYRGTWLVFGVVCVLLARRWLLIPAGLTIMVAFLSVFSERSRRRIGALVGALGVQVVLRWPPTLFHGLPSLVTFGLVVMLGVSAWQRSSRRVRRRAVWVLGGLCGLGILLSVPVVVAVILQRGNALAAERSAKAAFSTIGSGATASVKADLQRASVDAATAATAMNWWFAAGARLVPVVAQQDRFVTDMLQTAAQAAKVGVEQAPNINYHRLGYHDGQINLDRVRAMQAPMAVLDRQLVHTDHVLGDVLSPWLLGPLQSRAITFHHEMGRAVHGASLAIQAARVLPAVFGGDGVRHYFVAFMTPAESRGLDGILGAYGELTVDNGKVTLTTSGSVSDLYTNGIPPDQRVLSSRQAALAAAASFDPARYAEDWTYAPDLPTTAAVISQLYPQAGGVPIDGVLALDPYGLAALLKITGPISVPGLASPLTSANAAQFLLKGEYATFNTGGTGNQLRHEFLQEALQVAFHKLVNGSLPSPRTLSKDLYPAVQTGRIEFWSNHPAEQPILRSLGLANQFPAARGGDLLAVTTQNQGNNKLDAYLHTSIADDIAYDAATGRAHSQVTITLQNDAPSSGLPAYVLASPRDPGLASGTDRVWLTLYSPLTFDRVSVNGVEAGMSVASELGVRADSMYVNVPSGAVAQVIITLSGGLRARQDLPVTVRLQPAANPQSLTVAVRPAGNSMLASGRNESVWRPSSRTAQERSFRFVVP